MRPRDAIVAHAKQLKEAGLLATHGFSPSTPEMRVACSMTRKMATSNQTAWSRSRRSSSERG